MRILEGRLRSEVAARHDALLHQASRLREAEPALQGVTSTVGSLQGALRRVRAEIMEPYDQVCTQRSTESDTGRTFACKLTTPRVAGTLRSRVPTHPRCVTACHFMCVPLSAASGTRCNVLSYTLADRIAIHTKNTELSAPPLQVRTRTRQLRNLHETVDLLRQALRRLKLTAKLRAQLAAATAPAADVSTAGAAAGATAVSAIDLAKAAKLLADAEAVEEEGDLSGLAVLDADASLLANATQMIRTRADVRCSGFPSLRQILTCTSAALGCSRRPQRLLASCGAGSLHAEICPQMLANWHPLGSVDC